MSWIAENSTNIITVATVVMAGTAVWGGFVGYRNLKRSRQQISSEKAHEVSDVMLREINKFPALVDGVMNVHMTAWTKVSIDDEDRKAALQRAVQKEYEGYNQAIVNLIGLIDFLAIEHTAYLGEKWSNIFNKFKMTLLILKLAMKDAFADPESTDPNTIAKARRLLRFNKENTEESTEFKKSFDEWMKIMRQSLKPSTLKETRNKNL